MPEALVLLHGFAGTRRTWDRVVEELDPQRYRPLALDLPGHGGQIAGGPSRGAPTPGEIAFDSCVREVLAAAPERFALCGYSLGGRVALHVALAAPARVSRLILVSTSPGIEDAAERAERRAADAALAQALEREPFEDFIARWSAQPLFADDPPEVLALAREDQCRNDPVALAVALRGLSPGTMAPLWGRLGELPMPVTVVVGERDAKYRALGERMRGLCAEAESIVVASGHRVPLEDPAGLAAAMGRVS